MYTHFVHYCTILFAHLQLVNWASPFLKQTYIADTTEHSLIEVLKNLIEKAKAYENPIISSGYSVGYINVTKPSKAHLEYIYTDFNNNRPYFVFFHGVGGRPHMYIDFLNYFKERFNIVAFSLPYHGKSSTPPLPSTYDEFAEYSLNALKALIVRTRMDINSTVIAGHSLGGGVAWYVASKLNPYRLLLINSAGMPIERSKLTVLALAILERAFPIKEALRLDKSTRGKIFADMMIFLLEEVFNGKINTPDLVKRFLEVAENGFKQIPTVSNKLQTIFVTSTKELYFSSEYITNFMEHLSWVKFLKVKGPHAWPVLRPKNAKVIIPWL